MNFKKMSDDEIIAYLIKPIIKVLQEAGGQLSRTEIKERITAMDDDIAGYAADISTSKRSGKTYKKFNFKFNFAVKELSFVNILEFIKRNPTITLTDKGANIDLYNFDPMCEVVIPSKPIWEELHKMNASKKGVQEDEDIISDDVGIEDQYNEEFKEKVLGAISKMSPKKFEMLSRKLLSEMGIRLRNKGHKYQMMEVLMVLGITVIRMILEQQR